MKALKAQGVTLRKPALQGVAMPTVGKGDSLAAIMTLEDLKLGIAQNEQLLKALVLSNDVAPKFLHDISQIDGCTNKVAPGLLKFGSTLYRVQRYASSLAATQHGEIWHMSYQGLLSPVTRTIYAVPYAWTRKRTSSLVQPRRLSKEDQAILDWCWNNGGVMLYSRSNIDSALLHKIANYGAEMYRRLTTAKDAKASEALVEDIVLACRFTLKQLIKVLGIDPGQFRMLSPLEEKDMLKRKAARKLGAGMNTSGMRP